MKTLFDTLELKQAVDALSAGPNDRSEEGPEVVLITLSWLPKAKVLVGSYDRSGTPPDIMTEEEILFQDTRVGQLIIRLITDGTPFVTSTGVDDSVCTLQWTIRDAS